MFNVFNLSKGQQSYYYDDDMNRYISCFFLKKNDIKNGKNLLHNLKLSVISSEISYKSN